MYADTIEVVNQFQSEQPPRTESTPFVLSFGDRMHAENWANRLLQNGHSEVCFYTINTARIGPLFRIHDLVR
uniref:Uncharacterized protein n=1 Tax=Globisporangium ultimum (strain ATCC 200006 / CBS 805.95 / DAOM BR144) TaxID=431595 RepID=K3WHV5_GLOUD